MANKLAYRTEDEVRDSAKVILGFDKSEPKVKQGTGQITTFNQLGFKGVIDKPDGWYLPDDIGIPAIILETKSESEDIFLKKWEKELIKNCKITLTKYKHVVGILYIPLLKSAGRKYAFIDKWKKETMEKDSIMLPVDKTGNPDFAYMESYMRNLESAVSSSLTALRSAKGSEICNLASNPKWSIFTIEQIFSTIVKPQVYHTREVTQNDNGIPYVVRSKFNNGIKYFVDKPNGATNPPKVISFGAENATFFYQEKEWISGRDMYYIDTTKIDKHACLFITACLQPIATKYSYNFGLFPELLKKEKIKLPIDDRGNIDYAYMAMYMKALEISSVTKIKQLNFA